VPTHLIPKAPFAILASFHFIAISADNVHYNDGADHVLSDATHASDTLWVDQSVDNDPGTGIELQSGASIFQINAFHSSTIEMRGGSLGYATLENGSDFFINGGTILHQLNLIDHATATVDEGVIESISVVDDSSMEMWGSTVNEFEVNHRAKAEVHGGEINYLNSFEDSTLEVRGGQTSKQLYASDNGEVRVHDGDFQGKIEADGNSSITLSGGNVGASLFATDSGVITLDGYGFEIDDGAGKVVSMSRGDWISDEFGYNSTGTITGFLSDGTELNVSFTLNGGTADIQVVPELSSFTCLLIFLVAFGLRFRGTKPER